MKNKTKKLDIKKIKKQAKGITLIALVVTIIVLLILAAVAINLTIGNNGIFTRAQNATEKWKEASKNEQSEIDKVSNFLDSYLNGGESNNPETGEMTLVDMFKQAQKDGCLNLDGNCNNSNHLHIGDYVDYKNPTSGTYTITAEKSGIKNEEKSTREAPSIYDGQTYDVRNNQLNWRVLGIDEKTGGIKLIAGSPMKINETYEKDDPYLYLNGAEAYAYGPNEMNNACAMYKNEYAQEARSVNIEDIKEVLGIKAEEQIKEYNALPILSNATQYGEEFGPFEEVYTPETWLNGQQTTTLKGKTTGYVFVIEKQTDEFPVEIVDIANTRAKSMLFDNVEQEYGKAYGLAVSGEVSFKSQGYSALVPEVCFGLYSVCEIEDMTVVGVGNYPFDSNGHKRDFICAVRPVVSLKSNITKNEIARIPDKTEEEWNYLPQ